VYISYFTDEAHDDFAEALHLGKSWGLHAAEVRTIDGINILDATDEQVARAKKLLDQYEMSVSAVATPFLKCVMPGSAPAESGPMHGAKELSYDDHLRLLKRGVELAQFFGTNTMRIFSFWRASTDFWPTLQEAVAATLAACEGSGVVPCLENEGACCIGTSQELAEAAGRLTDQRLKFIWDPGNSTSAGMVPRIQDWDAFKDRIGLVHIKDRLVGANDKPIPPGQGSTGYAEQIRLIAQTYDGALTLEPHYRPNGDMTEGMRQCVVALKQLCAEAGIALS